MNNVDPSGHCYGFPSVVTWEGIEYVANMRGPSGQRRTVTGVGLECSEIPGGWIHYIIAEDAGPYCLERNKHKAMFEVELDWAIAWLAGENSSSNGLSIDDFKNQDGTISLYDSRRKYPDSSYWEQILYGGLSGWDFKLNSKDGIVFDLISAKGGVYRGAGDYKYGRFDFQFVQGAIRLGYKKGMFGIYAKGALISGSIAGKIPIGDNYLIIGLEGDIGSIGGGFNLEQNEDGWKVKSGFSYGIGGGIFIQWKKG